MRISLYLSILMMIGLTACQTTHPPIELSKGFNEDTTWNEVVESHTRRKDLYRLTDHILDARAVLMTPQMRAALVQNKGKFGAQAVQKVVKRLLSMDLKKQFQENALAPTTSAVGESKVMVLFAAYVADSQYQVFNATYSPWDIRLQRGDVWVPPDSIEDVRQSPALRSMFPFIGRFDKVFIMEFPSSDYRSNTAFIKGDPEVPLEFRFRSAIADVKLQWHLID